MMWDALTRDCEMKFEKDDIFDKMRQAALFTVAPEALLEEETWTTTRKSAA